MPKIDITRTELVWPGKYDEDGNLVPPRRVNLPFQVIERVNETRATREHKVAELQGHYSTLFDYWQGEKAQTSNAGDGWRNKLIWGDNLYVMGSLLERFAGQVDLIYIDPPFATGADFSFSAPIGDSGVEVTKEHSLIEEKAYRDTWGAGLNSYLHMMSDRLALICELLSVKGSLYVHCDWHVSHYLKIILDQLFGPDNFRNEIVWKRSSIATNVSTQWRNSHDVLLFYSSSRENIFNVQYGEYTESSKEHFAYENEYGVYQLVPLLGSGRSSGDTGKTWRGIDPNSLGKNGMHWLKKIDVLDDLDKQGKIYWPTKGGIPRLKYYLHESKGRYIPDLWDDIYIINSMAKESLGYDTQKPEALLDRIIKASTDPGNIIADFFCGSGTTLAVAEKLGRRWIGCDLGRYAIHTTRKRLMEIPECKPFEILNLGRYERQIWQGVTFDGQKHTQQMLIFEYLKFILELYGAQPLAGTQVLHGKKGSAVVHVGAVDAPVTIDEVLACLEECKQMKQKELHILGWEWEMGLANLMVDEAKGQGVKLLMLTIPREVMEQQAVEKGDIRFYELAYLEPKIQTEGKTVTVELIDFVIPNDDLIPPEVRQKIKKWSDYVDYWAIDWDFQNDTFVNGWTSYRTRKDRTLQLKSEAHEYAISGSYRIVVKVIDIFGNDTSQVFEVEVI